MGAAGQLFLAAAAVGSAASAALASQELRHQRPSVPSRRGCAIKPPRQLPPERGLPRARRRRDASWRPEKACARAGPWGRGGGC